MTTKGYLLETSLAAWQAVERVVMDFPCFLRKAVCGDSYIELEIQCRDEDLPAIERRLAPFV
jgi:hypothetical protein